MSDEREKGKGKRDPHVCGLRFASLAVGGPKQKWTEAKVE